MCDLPTACNDIKVIHLDWLCSSPTTKSYWDYEGFDAVVVHPMISRNHISECGAVMHRVPSDYRE